MTSEVGAQETLSESDKITLSHYLLLGLLTLLNILSMVDRQLLSSFANFIVPDLNLTNTEFGLLTGLLFMVFYSFMALIMGALADMYHRPRLIAAAVFLWSLCTAASGAAKGFASLALPRMLIGVGESTLSPAAIAMLADKFPPHKRGFASGFYYMGVSIGFGVSLLVAGYLGPAIGWRMCFYLLGGLGIALSLVVLFINDVPRRQVRDSTEKKASVIGQIVDLFAALRQSPALVFTIMGGVCVHGMFGATAFDQLWYVQERGYDRALIAQTTGWFGVAGGVLGNLIGGIGSDYWRKRTGKSRLSFLFWVLILLAPINIYYRLADPDSFFFWLGVFFTFFQLGVLYGPSYATIQELAPPHICSTVVAFNILMASVVGVGMSITASGVLIDYLIEAGNASPYTVSLLVFTIVSMLSIPVFWLAVRFTPDQQ
ncbi:MAG: MFS transporter [Gammaproteobacteria bacterium]|nr:MFS transporter [Gammaproteobacteria bacterium]